MKPTKEAFERYRAVQESGAVNMFSSEVCSLADLTKGEHMYIITHYGELMDEYQID